MENMNNQEEVNNGTDKVKRKGHGPVYWLIVIVGVTFIIAASFNIGTKVGKIAEGDVTNKDNTSNQNSNVNSNSNVDSNSNIESNSNNIPENKIDNLDVASAEKLLAKYHETGIGRSIQYTKGFTTELKQYLAWANTVNKPKRKCSDSFNVKLQSGETDVYYTKVGQSEFWCNSQTETISYDEINKTYKSLFGSKQEMPKSNFSNLISLYYYSDKTNSFVKGYIWGTGVGPENIDGYAVKNVEVKDNQLLVNVAYVELNYSDDDHIEYRINGKTQTTKYPKNSTFKSYNEFANSVAKKHVNELPVYQYVFEKENDNYVLVDFKVQK